MSYVHGCFHGCFWYKFNLLLLLLFVFLTYYIFLWIRPNNNGIFDILFVEGFNGYVFAHIVCGSGSKPGGIWGAVFTIYVAIVGSSAPQIQDPGYQVSPNLFSGAQEGPVLNIIPFLLSKRTMFW